VARVQFPDGTTVEAVGIQERRPDKPGWDYGCYLDASWRPTWNADVILPADARATAEAICNTFRRAKHGEPVEVGCIGGVGRTGTVLACMANLAGIPGWQVTLLKDVLRSLGLVL